MEPFPFHDANIAPLIQRRSTASSPRDSSQSFQMHSSLIRRLALERELKGHIGCVNTIAWNSQGSLLVSGSDDRRINIWRYSINKLVHCIHTGHTSNIFCTKFIPETCDDLVASGAGDCEVRVFNISHLRGKQADPTVVTPYAHFQCHTKRVKKLAVEVGNPNVVWSASEDGTLRQHDFREACSCPPSRPTETECRSILLDLRSGKKRSLSDPPNGTLNIKSCDISATRPHLLVVGGSDAFARLYDRRMLPPPSPGCRSCSPPPPCVNYFCPMHLSECLGRANVRLTHVAFGPDGEEVVISYSGEHTYLFDVNQGSSSGVQYSSGEIAKPWSFSSIRNGSQLQTKENICETISISSTTYQQHDRSRKLLQTAETLLKNEDNYYYGIELCNEVLDGHDCSTDSTLQHDCLCARSSLLLKRKWKNDAHMAVRDLNKALTIDSSSYRALHCMSEALVELSKHKEALEFSLAAQILTPSFDAAERIKTIKKHLAAAEEAEKSNMPREGAPRSINMHIRRSSYLDREVGTSKCQCSSSTIQNEKAAYKPEATVDMKRRFVGHCNLGTDIKQASFLGQKGEYIANGSDDGRCFIWEKKTGRLIKILMADKAVVNCIESHPSDSVVATSGIDSTIKIWTPSAPVPSMVAGGSCGPDYADVVEAMKGNQHSLSRSLAPLVPFEILERFGIPDSYGDSSEAVQCTQS